MVGCTSVKVNPIPKEYPLSHVCIENNPKVIVNDFVPVIAARFQHQGITTEKFENNQKPDGCNYWLTYTALRSWDVTTYLSHAELRVFHDFNEIGDAEYHLNGKGGLSLTKWGSVKSKMDPVVDELLSEQK